MPNVREKGTGRFKNDGTPSEWETFIEINSIVKDWLSNMSQGNREHYGSMLFNLQRHEHNSQAFNQWIGSKPGMQLGVTLNLSLAKTKVKQKAILQL